MRQVIRPASRYRTVSLLTGEIVDVPTAREVYAIFLADPVGYLVFKAGLRVPIAAPLPLDFLDILERA